MPYYKCNRCALRLYSAASKTKCSECGAPLGSTERMFDVTPLAQPRRSRSPIRRWAVDQRSPG